MQIISQPIVCDGCGFVASAGHIAERVARLEAATRFRPIHINTLFVAIAPTVGIENDFYAMRVSGECFNSMMRIAGIVVGASSAGCTEAHTAEAGTAKLTEFQHRGYYISYLSECPMSPDQGDDQGITDGVIGRLSANLIRRIRFNYKPKRIVLLGNELTPLIQILEQAGLGPISQVRDDQPFTVAERADIAGENQSQNESL